MRQSVCIVFAAVLVVGCSLSGAETSTPASTTVPATLAASPSPVPTSSTVVPTATQATTSTSTPVKPTAVPTRTRAVPRPNSVDNGQILVQFSLDAKTGMSISNICDEQSNIDYIAPQCNGSSPTSLFEFAVNGIGNDKSYQSNAGLTLSDFHTNADGSLSIAAAAKEVPLSLRIDISAPVGEPAAIIRIKARNTSQKEFYLRLVLPKLDGLQRIGQPDMWGAIPQEIGSVGPLNDSQSFARNPKFGMQFDPNVSLPRAINSMDVATVYNHKDGGGVFFASLDNPALGGVAPIQFNIDSGKIAGYWYAPIEPQQEVDLPGLAIGVFSQGDWHAAVDYYVSKNRPQWSFPQIPAWFRDAGAVYSFSGGGAGGIYLDLPNMRLDARIKSFEDLPNLLTEARALGTNIVYLPEYWEGVPADRGGPYFNKGNYVPRSDLGGAAAFTDGIRKIHQQGGRVILYVEPFIIYQASQIGMQNGVKWEGHDLLGAFDRWYPGNYKMVAPFVPWQDYMVSVAERLVRDYGADGIFLDSYGWQMNWQVRVGTGTKLYSPQEYNLGVLQLAGRVRSAIQAIKPDAVVMGETTAGPLVHVWDGGLSADFGFESSRGITKIVASPVRYGLPEENIFSNGRNLNELHQIYAAGHNLALCCDWPGTFMYANAAHIRTLVELRQKYQDALVHGAQAYQPRTDSIDIAAYFYEGTDNQIITVANTSGTNFSGPIALRESEANTSWKELITGKITSANGTSLPVAVPPNGILVLLKVPG